VILDTVALENFGPFSGRQEIALGPLAEGRPVVLIGALNGAGKTTLLDAVQLALYGKLAQTSSRGSLAYESYLRRATHRAAPTGAVSAVEVCFRHAAVGEERHYVVRRAWRTGQGVAREELEVRLDGVVDRVLMETWDTHVETILPRRIAPLFLFDGEKVEGLADPQRSSEMLGSAVHALLGVDLVERLRTDLLVVERRNRVTKAEAGEQRRVDEAEEELRRRQEHYEALRLQRGGVQNELDRVRLRLEKVEDRFRREGGELFERRQRLEAEYAVARAELVQAETVIHDLAGGPTPLLLAMHLVRSIRDQDLREREGERASILGAVLEERDAELLRYLQAGTVGEIALEGLASFLAQDREQRVALGAGESYLNLSSDGRASLVRMSDPAWLEESRGAVARALDRAHEIKAALEDLDRTVAQVPTEEAIQGLLDERQRAAEAYRATAAQLAELDEELRKVLGGRDTWQRKLGALREALVDVEFEREASARVVQHARRVRETLGVFRLSVVKHHVTRIESLVLDSLRALMRKDAGIADLSIDPETFALTLYDCAKREIPAERLSAGERQLLAISLLWGLARAAGRPLPVLVDTPLGRLDSIHRTHLVERYFPQASHQVVVLSTDAEVDADLYRTLKPFVGREYVLSFDEASGSSHVDAGYFWPD
jgi:DNA sulfur modification protein DndD